MFALELTKDGHTTTSVFDDFDEAVKFFKLNSRLGFICKLYNWN